MSSTTPEQPSAITDQTQGSSSSYKASGNDHGSQETKGYLRSSKHTTASGKIDLSEGERARNADHSSNKEEPAAEQHGILRQMLRLLEFITFFNWVAAVIHSGQLLMALLYFVNQNYFYACMTYTKQQFGVVLSIVTQWFTPTLIRVSGDESVEGQITKTKDGRLVTSFPERLVLVSNHQIYTEWLYLWWIAYTSGQHGSVYIILKESLKYIPFIGPAMQLYGFIFMARNWAKDQLRLQHRLRKLTKQAHSGPLSGKGKLDPMWLLIFPEGTNLSRNTRKRSKAWSEKSGIPDFEHLLLPRSTGLLFCLQELQGTVDYVYDCTIAYEGVPRGQYAQDIFTLRSTFLAGRPPRSVNMHWRRIPLSSIPLSSPDAFSAWLTDQWRLKEALIEEFVVSGRFPAARSVGHVETGVRLGSIWEIGHIFGGWLVFAGVVAAVTWAAGGF